MKADGFIRILRIFFLILFVAFFCPFSYGKIIYVDDDATRASDGMSWASAYLCLQDALAVARSGDEIRVANGVYKPDQHFVKGRSPHVQASGDRTATFQLVNGVTIKGSYAGFGEPDPNGRDVKLYETILSGDLNGDDGPGFTNNEENSYRVVTSIGTDQTTVLDGFIITSGNANSPIRYNGGSGMRNIYSSLTLNNCTFSSNYSYYGGTIRNNESNPILNYCTFTKNVSDFGGSIYNTESSPTLTNCTFSGNSAYTSGGAITNVKWSSPTITNCKFTGNSAGWGGGGMTNDTGCNPKLTNCTFIGNSAGGVGGGIENVDASSPTLINCTFSENSSGLGSGVSNYFDSNPTLTNCILWGNTAQNNSQIYNYLTDSVTITYSDVQGGWPGEGNIDTDPCFADPGYWADTDDPNIVVEPNDPNAVLIDGDYHLKSQAGRFDPNSQRWIQDDVTSPCIDAGDPNSPIGHEPFPNGGIINMGAYGGSSQASKSPSGQHALYGGGTGEPNNPYLIYTAEQMNTIGLYEEDWDKHFKLMADIDLSDYTGIDFNIIGNDIVPFSGIFDGNGYRVLNFTYCSTEEDSIGLFGYIRTGLGSHLAVQNVGLVDPNVDAANARGVGALIGELFNGIISGCYVEGGRVSGDSNVGGLLGWTSATNMGPLERNIVNCYTSCQVSGNSGVGGIAGNVSPQACVLYCQSFGTIIGKGCIGGLIGNSGHAEISHCYSFARVIGKDNTGGLVGLCDGGHDAITACAAFGSADGESDTGGLVGRNIYAGIADSYSVASVSGVSRVGGLVGSNQGTVSTCYAAGLVKGQSQTGGLIGSLDADPFYPVGSVSDSFWDIETSGQSTSAGGTGLTTAEMQSAATFLDAGWDFVDETANGTEDIWWILEGRDYPRLWWEHMFSF